MTTQERIEQLDELIALDRERIRLALDAFTRARHVLTEEQNLLLAHQDELQTAMQDAIKEAQLASTEAR